MVLKNFTFCFSKNLIWRKPQVYTFIVLYFWGFCFGSLTVAGKMHLMPIWGLFFCDIFETPSTPHPASFCSSMARVWELAAEQVGKTHSRGNIGEKTWRKNTDEWRRGDEKIGKLMLFWVQSRIAFTYWMACLYIHNILLGLETRCKPYRSHEVMKGDTNLHFQSHPTNVYLSSHLMATSITAFKF